MRISSRFRPTAAALLVLGAALLGLRGAPGPAAGQAGGTAPGQVIMAQTVAYAAPSGGICGVPGVGDIGGLFGFCSVGSSGLIGAVNNLCAPGPPEPEQAAAGLNSLVRPPAAAGSLLATPYNEYGISGQYWAATGLQCSDMTAMIGNSVAAMLFDFAKALDRVTITVYQAAASEGILGWLENATNQLISGLGKAIYFPYVAVVVILGAIWLAWQGLIRKRGTLTLEGTIWMVLACAAAIWLIGRPADFTGLGRAVSDGISTSLNAAFANLPTPGQASCLPVSQNDPQIKPASFAYTSGRTVVDQNANELWTVLVCKPWLDGEFGSTAYAVPGGRPTAVDTYARSLLWSQAIAVNEQPTVALIQAKQAAYTGIAQTIQQQDPGIYPLFQGKEWTTRLQIGFAALLAALVAGLLVLLISVTLILLKLAFLLLLVAGPFFLLVGIHPGFGRVVAVRWFELLVGVLLRQAAVALALSVLLYSYALIMGTTDSVLPWALKILMITLVTIAVFIYRKPFQHLFAAVGYGAIGSAERAEANLGRAAATAAANTRTAATVGVPGFAAYRVAAWARRNPAQAAGLAMGAASTSALVTAAEAGAGGDGAGSAAAGHQKVASSAGGNAAARARAWGSSAGTASASEAPPLRLPGHSGGAPVSWTSNGTSASGGDLGGAGTGRPAGGRGRWGGTGWPGSGAGTGGGGGRAVPPRPRQAQGQAQPPARRPAAGLPPAAPGGGRGGPLSRGGQSGRADRQPGGKLMPWQEPRSGAAGPGGGQRPPRNGDAGQAGPGGRGPFWLRPIRRGK